MKLILHIGTEKTATSTLQSFLYRNRSVLAAQGYALLDSPTKPSNRAIAAFCLDEDDLDDDYLQDINIRNLEEKSLFIARFKQDFDNEIDSLPENIHTVIITSEHLHSRLTTEETLTRLKALLDCHFDHIDIICYFREQSEVARSLYSTAMKTGHTLSFSNFLKSVHPHQHYYNYFTFFKKWEAIFGKHALHARIYNPQQFINHDIRQDFLTLLPHFDSSSLHFDHQHLNASLGKNGLQLCRMVNTRWSRYNPDGSLNALRFALVSAIEKSRLAREGSLEVDNAFEIYQMFDESNIQFAKSFLGTSTNPFPPPPGSTASTEDRSFAFDDVEDLVEKLLDACAKSSFRVDI